MSVRVYVGFGANLGDRPETFKAAVRLLGAAPTTAVAACSRLYETEPVDLTDAGGRFINAVIALDTELNPTELLRELIRVEKILGKSAVHRSNLSRLVDLDLLLYGEEIIETKDLTAPHARLHHRAFALIPLVELAPTLEHPKLGRTMEDLLARLPLEDLQGVREYTNP